MKKLQLIFADKYSTIHRIGVSSQSEVYLAFQADTEQQYAVKLQKQDNVVKQLQRQAKIYRIIKGGVGIPNLYWYGVDNQYRALVTDILGPSLQQLLKFCEGKFSLKTVLLIADQVMDRLQWVHSKNLVYGDLDTENLLVGLKEKADKIFLVDYGSCRKFVDGDQNHVGFGDQDKKYSSNIRFKSIHGHIGKLQSRRDDLESLGYLLVYMLKGKLPWDHVEEEEAFQRNLLVKEKKVSIPVDILCQGLQAEFVKYFGYVQSLQFEEEPDYVWIKRLFKDLFDRLGYDNNRVLDWAEKHK